MKHFRSVKAYSGPDFDEKVNAVLDEGFVVINSGIELYKTKVINAEEVHSYVYWAHVAQLERSNNGSNRN